MRELTDHKLNGLNDALKISVLDKPGQGGPCHRYLIHTESQGPNCAIEFQNGPIKEAGVNGISGEALIAINIDRLRSFQAGPFASEDNAHALDHLQKALFFLQKRTLKRLARGVEGTSTR